MNIIPDQDKKHILKSMNGFPPFSALLKCKTDEQKNEWGKLYDLYRLQALELEAYFCGQPSIFQQEPNSYTKKDREFFDSLMRFHLDFYQLIRDCWGYLKEASCRFEITIPDSPGHFFTAFLKAECEATIDRFLYYSEFSPRSNYQLYLDDKKIKLLRTKEKLSHSEKTKIAEYDKRVDKLIKNQNKSYLLLYCMVMDISRENKKRDKSVALSWERFEESADRLDRVVHSSMQPKKNPKGYKCHNGLKSPLS